LFTIHKKWFYASPVTIFQLPGLAFFAVILAVLFPAFSLVVIWIKKIERFAKRNILFNINLDSYENQA